MRKFIHSNFELDLSAFKITDTAENPWFTGTYFTKYSYPFNIALTKDIDMAMGFLSHYNSTDAETLFEGIYVHGDAMEKAVLEVEECEQELSVTVRYGLDDFPNFTKKLAELPLLQLQVADIYQHAKTIISQVWPDVNYNFPQIHTDKIDPESDDVWFAFEKIINNYRAGAFLENNVDLSEDITYNRNIIQPLPYLLYLLQAGFADAGFTLRGDVLENATIKKMLVYTDTEYYTTIAQESMTLLAMAEDHDTYEAQNGANPHITLQRTQEIAQPGKYRITGTMRLRKRFGDRPTNAITVSLGIRYRNVTLFSHSGAMLNNYYDFNIDVTFETLSDLQPDFLTFYYDGGFVADDMLFNLEINPVRLHDEGGNAVASIINLNQVDLKRAVPDMTFGDLVKEVLAEFRMDLTTAGTDIFMNYIAGEMQSREVIDLSMYDVKFPKRTFSKGNSFLLKYEDVTSSDYSWLPVFQNIEGYSTSGYKIDDKTTEVPFKALPLPLLRRNNVQTAHGFLDEKTKPLWVIYNGLVGDLNLSQDPAALQVPALHLQYHNSWLASRINASSYLWTFQAYIEQIAELEAKSRVHAYRNIHLVKSLQKTEVKPDLFEIELQTEVFK
ncbi:hypothetical protein [Flavobacterium psychrotrophum]|uniref:hypothetical protein n=1 Tax=Flavobacterium psychrotrophum TaxID=2294119 RepID=UPI000E31FF4E|nr:hypothetical protein [Flavobacterium psychrotrophum]